MKYDIVIIGGGAAGFFTAIQCAENNPTLKIVILEKTLSLLSKVKVSGGGRCNVTHACFDPRELTQYYPRGEKALLGPFHKFMCGDMMGWLEDRGVETKIEEDGRVFPVSNNSQTIIDCFLDEVKKYDIEIKRGINVKDIERINDEDWKIITSEDDFEGKNVVFTTGSSRRMWDLLDDHGHTISNPIPSLFTFKIKDPLIKDLMGLAVNEGSVQVEGTKLKESGPILITHWGLSGPGILKLSSRGARDLYQLNYNFTIKVNWTNLNENEILEKLSSTKNEHPKKRIENTNLFSIPNRLWQRHIKLVDLTGVKWAELPKKAQLKLAQNLTNYPMNVTAKATNKEEFVTAGGITLKEVNFKNMQSKILPNIYFAGEILDIDALTGGFNFQAAWTTSFLIGQSIND